MATTTEHEKWNLKVKLVQLAKVTLGQQIDLHPDKIGYNSMSDCAVNFQKIVSLAVTIDFWTQMHADELEPGGELVVSWWKDNGVCVSSPREAKQVVSDGDLLILSLNHICTGSEKFTYL